MNLANKYRPLDFKDVCSQEIIIKILEKQLELESYPNCILFSGISGGGKTSLARILATKINKNQGSPIEIDAASNNGVDNIRNIIAEANERSLSSKYKIFIIDEAHMITTAGWNAFLKCLEEPPTYTIFIFCTTDPQKIPLTIQNRIMRFNLTPINDIDIENRLNYICQQEGFINYQESNNYISRLVNGSMRKAISYIEKVSSYDKDLNINNTLKIIGDCPYKIMFNMVNKLIDRDDKSILTIIDDLYISGIDFKLFVDQLITFILDLVKYCITNSINNTTIPNIYIKDIDYTTGIEDKTNYFKWLLDKLLDIKDLLKYDYNAKNTLLMKLLNLIRG